MARISTEARRDAKAAYRDRKQEWAIVAVVIGEAAWLTLTPDAKALENRLGFMLRQGNGPMAAMNVAYREIGAIELEVLEKLDEALSPMARERVGKARLAHWADLRGADVF